MSVIKIAHLTKDYGHDRGVFDISFQVEKGTVYGFLGPNGAGKTTVIRHIMGFSRPQEGLTTVYGLNSWKHASDIQNDLGYLPGEIAFPENITGLQFIRMLAELRGMKDMTYTNELIDKFELDPSGSLKRMSLGMKRKLGIVAAFMHDPAVLILDEPTSGLDAIMQERFIEFIKDEKDRGKTILLSSHIFNEIDATCDVISIIKEGHLVTTFLADELRNPTTKTYKIEFKLLEQCQDFNNKVKKHSGFEVQTLRSAKNQVEISIDDTVINDFISLIADYDIKFFSEIKFTLEDYFMKFYDRNTSVGVERGE